jgi:hypothetical protein
MVEDDSRPEDGGARRPWRPGPVSSDSGWLAMNDDEILFRLETLEPDLAHDPFLMEIVRSDRHFFVRQEAAKKIFDVDHLKAHLHDRHIGQILARGMARREDIAYLRRLLHESHHVEVRKAAEAQLGILKRGDGQEEG